jgi:hypothetical protein
MAYSRRRKKKSSKKSQSEVFQGMGAAWENETKSGDALISLKVDIEDFLDWLDAIKLDKLPEEETKLSIILLEQTKSKKRGAPDFVVYGLDPVLPEGEEPEEEEEEKPRRRKKKKRDEMDEEDEPKPKKKRRAKKSEEDEKELDLDFEEE